MSQHLQRFIPGHRVFDPQRVSSPGEFVLDRNIDNPFCVETGERISHEDKRVGVLLDDSRESFVEILRLSYLHRLELQS
jgi:hypothetical protein